jgi:hypothetical protein
MKSATKLTLAAAAACLFLLTPFRTDGQGQSREDFAKTVAPVLTGTCAQCHNERVASGGLNIAGLTSHESVLRERATWEKILQRVQAGEMPPPGPTKPAETVIRAFVTAIKGEFDRADANLKPDPGRVIARRLNRNEYSNTIRDLLAVDFRAEKYFPTDDSGDGFDNIGEVLSV